MVDLKFFNIIVGVLLTFFISFIITFFTKNNSPVSLISNCIITSGLISLTSFFCLLYPSKSWISIFNLIFMFYIKSVIENNMDQKNKRIIREKMYKSYKNRIHKND